MTNFTLISAAAALLLVATPAMARQRFEHYRYGYSHRMPRLVYRAYGFYRGDDFAPQNFSGDFDRSNTFNSTLKLATWRALISAQKSATLTFLINGDCGFSDAATIFGKPQWR